MRSLEQWLAYQAQVHPQAIDLSLDRLRLVLERLQWQQPKVPVITIAGTNGKGSVSAYCAAILRAAGFRVGAFTSPHLRDYRERIQLDDRWVHADELTDAFERIEVARGSVALTFFEFNALAALLAFDAAALDAWVLEIGMGGRLDAVNVVDGDVAVVTSIGLDHQEYLGDTLEAIAREKAGIFRPGKTAVIGGREPSLSLEEAARAMNSPLKRLAIEYNYILDGAGWRYRGTRWDLPHLPAPALLGAIQFTNAATAIAALEEVAPRLKIPAAAVARGLAGVFLPGRFQLIAPREGAPAWVLDVAHNPDAARVLAQNLAANPVPGKTLAVCGILMDKNAAGIAAIMDGCIDEWWCASIDGTRGRSGVALADEIRDEVAVSVSTADSVAEACQAALAAAASTDRIVVFGSFHTVGPALDWLESQGLLPPPGRPEYTSR
ncbi:MAG TPA: bifunctional tetrahydrofolate synthase/dihydrofolate synthase [Steroidobacteraceae bacterium]|jgi:dihydrofolate synthase/folylpolyglutamate synthase|nr:bifunctional tetrahydrofolate synthase/dihydrofolate synthase [Steroidobacteraceae bacterium]